MNEKLKFDADFWTSACLHILYCGKDDCSRCQEIERAVKLEKERVASEQKPSDKRVCILI